jgi:hypothetical protein
VDVAFFDEDEAAFFAPVLLPLEGVATRRLEDFLEDEAFFDEAERLTNLLNRFPSSSDSSRASLSRSNHSKNWSHSTSSSVSSPLNPGKSMRRMPGSSPEPVAFTCAGCPPRASTHCRISS